ncbi:hypothetical protein EPUS_04867 [Endocarpon pusillum Z07020]|uniref:Helicase C-terminal domain-containing protein n=1 Tax=Endocarpon pusillum (strain Z07020 / HMAS-L-300199) TaxID=1263415 RepID=U1HWE9_ENDPU|nr:uncharacterized protein EPUS_04867 [Endocarpon pusillum Z07020]ERF75085.1 hypothetical protein EPUS_04867 [Endocarpon pusillum Z07020]
MPRQPSIQPARQLVDVQIPRMTLIGRVPLRFSRCPKCRAQVRAAQAIVPLLPRTTQPVTPTPHGQSREPSLLSRALENVPFRRQPKVELRSVADRRPLQEATTDEKGRKKAEEQQQDDPVASLVFLILVYLCVWEVASLDLTVATQAFILEPQWNPMAEEQALSRIHRMGQTKAVKTVRYIMQDSIEENIYELQQRKLKLAALTISGEVQPDDHNHLDDLRFLLS